MLSQEKGGLSVERDLNLAKAKVSGVGSVLVLRSRTRFSKVPITFGPEKLFMFAAFAFKIRVSKILKMIQ